jgi:3-dehydroquinate synthase
MAAEATLSELAGIADAGLADHIREALERQQLPVTIPSALSTDAIIDCMHSDKKSRAGKLRFALPRSIGEMARGDDGGWTLPVEEPLIRQLLDTR